MKKKEFILPAQLDRLLSFVVRLPADKKHKVTVANYVRSRSVEQNAVSHRWYGQISRQKQEDTPEAVKRECKLLYGVPILRAENPGFNEFFQASIEPLCYEAQLLAMRYVAVTSEMTVKQMQKYMTDLQHVYGQQGIQLLYPNEIPLEAYAA